MSTSLEHIRHTLAHLLAAAVLELYPDAKPTIGPAIDNGFYYDFEFPLGADGKSTSPVQTDLKDIEKRMRKLLPSWKEMAGQEVTPDQARDAFKGNPYKTELIEEIHGKGENITLYTAGHFTDLCRGGHAENPAKEIPADSFKLSRIAGAYWRGDEKNAMLTRIYGLAFESREALDAYLTQLAEAEKRDHKKLGKELGLFLFSDLVGSGLPLWTPKGTIIRELLNDYVWEMRRAKGYQKVTIPHITKKDLYETSGHWAKFKDELFKIETREKHVFAMKPMNCPHHTQIYANELRSYRDMPQRYAETTMVYRDEQSGELSGLSRVRAITQDDAHVFCRKSQIKNEIFAIWDIIDSFYKTFGFKDLRIRISRHDPAKFENYIGTPEVWKTAEDQLVSLVKERGISDVIDGLGEAAMYGPKIDFIAKDSIGRTLQVATIQLDFNMPERFDLACMNEKGEKERIVMIHCAIMGSIERFMATLIEHTGGLFPFWLSPVQVQVIPVAEAYADAAQKVHESLRAANIRSEIDLSNDSFGKKIRGAKTAHTPYFIILGEKDVAAGKVTLESRDQGQIGQVSIEGVLKKFQEEVKERK
ncbi:MAG: thrS [Candidatus Parcubacteria bacterium]|nr:thrS [Candidatus Parcubacteria bacterium]